MGKLKELIYGTAKYTPMVMSIPTGVATLMSGGRGFLESVLTGYPNIASTIYSELILASHTAHLKSQGIIDTIVGEGAEKLEQAKLAIQNLASMNQNMNNPGATLDALLTTGACIAVPIALGYARRKYRERRELQPKSKRNLRQDITNGIAKYTPIVLAPLTGLAALIGDKGRGLAETFITGYQNIAAGAYSQLVILANAQFLNDNGILKSLTGEGLERYKQVEAAVQTMGNFNHNAASGLGLAALAFTASIGIPLAISYLRRPKEEPEQD